MITSGNETVGCIGLCRYAGDQRWTGRVGNIRGTPHTFGRYTLKDNTIHITELPLRTWSNDYIAGIRASDSKKLNCIKKLIDNSTDIHINITIELMPGAVDILEDMGDLCFTDGIEQYFMLYSAMSSNLNMLAADGSVLEFQRYEEVLVYWYRLRKEHYKQRVERILIGMEVNIDMLENTLRYIDANLQMSAMSKNEQDAKLSAEGYTKYHMSRITVLCYVPNSELRAYMSDGNYDYLLNTTDRKRSREARAKLVDNIAKHKKEYEEFTATSKLGKFIGAQLWIDELAQLSTVINRGQTTGWLYEDNDKYTY
jgi:DNA gyrase/topoisomerase IV subunit A